MKPLHSRWVAGAAVLAAAAGFLAYLTQVRDPDMFHHMAYGREIMRNGLQRAEPFLFPLRGQLNGPMPYWLGSVVIYLWASFFGDGAMAWFSAIFGAVMALIILVDARPRSGRHTPLTLLATAAVLFPLLAFGRYRAFARPELLSTTLLALLMLALRRYEDGKPRALYAFPFVAVIWTNLHPSVTVGVVPVAVLVASGLLVHAVNRVTGWKWSDTLPLRQLWIAAGLGVAALLASLLSPSPFNPVITSLRFAAETLGLERFAPTAQEAMERILPFTKRMVLEMQPLDLSALKDTFGTVLAVTLLGFVLNWRRIRLRELVTVVAFTVLAFSAGRFAVILAVVAAPITARNLGEFLESLPERWLAGWARPAIGAAIFAAAAAGCFIFPIPSVVQFGTSLRAYAFPIRGVDYMVANRIQGPIFNTYHFGGYVEWRTDRPVFQDGRGLLNPGDEEASVAGPQNYPVFNRLDFRYRFEALVVNYPMPDPATAASLATSAPEADWGADRRIWALVAFDDGGLLYLRRGGRYQALIDRDEFRVVRPANTYLSVPNGRLPEYLSELRRSVTAAPACVRCRQLLGATAVNMGSYDEAWAAVSPLIDERPVPELAGLILVAAEAAEGRDQPDEAVRLYRELLRLHQEEAVSRRALARIALKRGAVRDAGEYLEPALNSGGSDPADIALALDVAKAAGRKDLVDRFSARLRELQTQQTAMQYQDRGMAELNRGNLQGAVSWYESSIQVFETPQARSALGQVYLEMGRADEAERQQRRALQLNPNYSMAWFNLAQALAARGDRVGAANAYRAFMKLEPSGFWSAKAKQSIDQLERR
jgi:tetratricopeptide (TPR) repeat protein